MLTYDQMSAVRIAFDEAHVPVERRRSQRLSVWCSAQIVPCTATGDAAGAPIDIVVVDFSSTGIGILHSGRLKVRARYLLEIPRPQQLPSLRVVFTVVRCNETDGGMFDVELSPEEILDVVDYAGANRHPGAPATTAAATRAGLASNAPAKGPSPLGAALICLAFITAGVVTLVHLLEPPEQARAKHVTSAPPAADPASPR